MPGELPSANTWLKEENRLVWKVDAYRLLGEDFVLEAESQTIRATPTTTSTVENDAYGTNPAFTVDVNELQINHSDHSV